MATSRDLIVRILADTSKLDKGVQETNGKLGALGKTAKIVGGAFAAYAAADVAIDFLGDATKAAEEDKKSQALLANQLKATNSATKEQIAAVEDHISVLSRQTGVMDDDLRPAYAALARASGDTEQANRELAIAMDIAAGRGIDLQTVTTALEKAHNGNTGALGRLGIATKDAEGNTLSLEAAMAGAAKTYEGAAEAAVTPGQRMSVAFAELKEQIGTALLPVLENLSTFMADTLLPAFQKAIIWIQENWPEIENAIRETFNRLQPIIKTFVGLVQTQFAIVKGVFTVISDLLHGEWGKAWEAFGDMVEGVWRGIAKIVSSQVDVVKSLIGGMITALKNAVNAFIDLWNGLDFTFEGYDIPGPGPNIPGFTVGLPDLPHLARGGIVTRPTLAMVGESGPEAVIPLGRGGNGGGMTVNIGTVTVPDARGFVQMLQQIDRTYGGVPINVRVPA